MNEFKGTPGPWSYVWSSGSVDIFRLYPDGSGRYSPLAKVRDSMGDFEKTAANAALLAASPKLFEALNDFLNHFEGKIPLWLFEKAETAISEALGKDQ